MLQNEYLVAKIGADTAENERIFAEFLPKIFRRELRRHDPAAAPRLLDAGGRGGPPRFAWGLPTRAVLVPVYR